LAGWLVSRFCWPGAMVRLQLQYDQRQQIADSNSGNGAGYS